MTPTDNIQPGTGSPLANDISKDNVLIVDWDGPDDPENPFNWTVKKKLGATMSIALITLLTYEYPLQSANDADAQMTGPWDHRCSRPVYHNW